MRRKKTDKIEIWENAIWEKWNISVEISTETIYWSILLLLIIVTPVGFNYLSESQSVYCWLLELKFTNAWPPLKSILVFFYYHLILDEIDRNINVFPLLKWMWVFYNIIYLPILHLLKVFYVENIEYPGRDHFYLTYPTLAENSGETSFWNLQQKMWRSLGEKETILKIWCKI